MEVKQIYSIINSVTNEVLGKSDLVQEDLSNIVDVGTEVFNSTSVDHYVKSLVNHIGKVVFVDRPYTGNVPSLVMDNWEYGSVLEKSVLTYRLQVKTVSGNFKMVRNTVRTFSINRQSVQSSSTVR